MVPQQRRQRSQVLRLHLCPPPGLTEHPLNHQSVDIDQANLQQMQRQSCQLLMVTPIASKLTAAPIEDKVIRTIPALHYIQTILNLGLFA